MLLDMRNVTMSFGGVPPLRDVSFSVREGEILGLIGPNGAGKTTLFHVLTSMVSGASGDIVFRGERIEGLSTHRIIRRGVGRTFQNIRLFPRMTARENVMVGRHTRSRAGGWQSVLRGRAGVRRGGGWRPKASAAGRAGGGDERKRNAGDPSPHPEGPGPRRDGHPDRTRHVPGDAGVRPARRPQLRREDRRGDAGGDPERPRRSSRLPREGGGG